MSAMFAINPILLHFLLASPCVAVPATLPDNTPTPTPTSTASSNDDKGWPKSKQAGVIVGCIIGGAIVLFIWGWILKGNKMFKGSKILWVKSQIGSAESKRTAREQRLEGKRKGKEERDRFWNQPARTKPTRAQMEMEVEMEKTKQTLTGGAREEGNDGVKL